MAQSQYSACTGCLPTVTVAAASSKSQGLDGADYLGAELSIYSALTDSFYEVAGIRSASVWGIRYGIPALLSDMPAAVGSVIGLFQTANAYSSGNYFEASQAGGATLGGIAGAEAGAAAGAVLGFGVADLFTVPVGAVVGGVYGAYKGSQIGGAIYNNGFQPLDSPGVPVVSPY